MLIKNRNDSKWAKNNYQEPEKDQSMDTSILSSTLKQFAKHLRSLQCYILSLFNSLRVLELEVSLELEF